MPFYLNNSILRTERNKKKIGYGFLGLQFKKKKKNNDFQGSIFIFCFCFFIAIVIANLLKLKNKVKKSVKKKYEDCQTEIPLTTLPHIPILFIIMSVYFVFLAVVVVAVCF